MTTAAFAALKEPRKNWDQIPGLKNIATTQTFRARKANRLLVRQTITNKGSEAAKY